MRWYKTYIIILVTTIVSCGSFFAEYPEPPDLSGCLVREKSFVSGLKGTTIPVPLTGVYREYRLYTKRPENWSFFIGTVHLKKIEWNIKWVKEMKILVGPYTIAQWKKGRWHISSTVDIGGQIKDVDDDQLSFEVKMSGTGIKPGKKFIVDAKIELYFCGETAGYIVDI